MNSFLFGHFQSVKGRKRKDEDIQVENDAQRGRDDASIDGTTWLATQHERVPAAARAWGVVVDFDGDTSEICHEVCDNSDTYKLVHGAIGVKDVAQQKQK